MEEKHHEIQNDELINDTYQIIKYIGSGAFSKVYKVVNLKNNKYYALKQLKCQEKFHRYGLKEIDILKNIKDEAKAHFCCNLKGDLIYKNHICLIFNLYNMNFYQLLRSRNFIGLSLKDIKSISKQILIGLDFIKKRGIIHCDLKPENIVIENYSNDIKIIDFGSSYYQNNKIYTYIQSRYYRSPEVVLGYNFSPAIDMWSFGCIIFELYTGKPLFKCHNCIELITLITEVLDIPTNKILEKSSEMETYFIKSETLFSFKKKYYPLNYMCHKKKIRMPNSNSIKKILSFKKETISKDLKDFIDIITKCIVWDPKRRLTPSEGLTYNFISHIEIEESNELEESQELEDSENGKLIDDNTK